ncbi:MAG: PilT/PilU family type 4a pilus ATPase [Sporomusaceae bacterium]|jgi:twitching motility protein PilT|nr:PilT/PilU family type 4a pilus ATPase [Sporomusaceae bacterium]
MDVLLKEAALKSASDIHLTVGAPPILRINDQLIYAEYTDYAVLSQAETQKMFEQITDEVSQEKFRKTGELDFAYEIAGVSRFRVNAYRQRGSIALAIRVIKEKAPELEELGHLEILKSLANKPHGLVLVTGPAGAGKSTTLAAMLNYINEERCAHIITLEDPIEFWYHHQKSIVNQREIGSDSLSFAAALRAALREDPNIIMVGEMRDAETISTAITAAETGHLVLASLHTGDTTQAVDRIIDSFAPHQQQQVRSQLALSLQGIIAQQLVPRKDGCGRVVAAEALLMTPAIANLIREGRNHQIYATIQTNSSIGMQTMDMSLRELFKKGLISYKEVSRRIVNREMIQQMKKD